LELVIGHSGNEDVPVLPKGMSGSHNKGWKSEQGFKSCSSHLSYLIYII
jgi:hypothetical protein